MPKKFELKIYSNKTILELRIEIAKKIKTTWDHVKLRRTNLFNRDIPDTENGKTIGELRFRNNETL